jgi:hypothetical protein
MKDLKAAAPVPLTAGKHILRITCLDNNSVWLSQIKLVRGEKTIAIDPGKFTGQGGGRAQAIISDARGFFSMWDGKGHALEWTIANAAAGDYTLSLGCASSDVAVRELKINGKVVPGFESFNVPHTGGWRNWCDEELPGKVALQEGRNVLRLTNLEGSLNLTFLRLSAPGKPDIIINAIDLTHDTGPPVQIHAPAASYISGWDRAGQWLEWNFNAAARGEYMVTIRHKPPPDTKHGTAPADSASPREFQLNGAAVRGLEAYMMPGTSNTRDWLESVLPVPMTLRAGANVLKITNLKEGALDVYEFRFTPAGVTDVKKP